jgi:DNA repair exonuclease SbcCD ATPase subunit
MYTIAFLALTYVFVPGGPNIISANLDLQRALTIRREHGSHFLWFKRDGHAYVIRDRETLDRIDALFADARAMDPDQERLHAKMRPLEDRENDLDREADAISDDDHRTRRDEEHLRELQRELRDVESKLRDYEREEERLDRRRDRLEMDAEAKMVPIVDDAIRRGIAKRE